MRMRKLARRWSPILHKEASPLVFLKGGVGNQLFQTGMALALVSYRPENLVLRFSSAPGDTAREYGLGELNNFPERVSFAPSWQVGFERVLGRVARSNRLGLRDVTWQFGFGIEGLASASQYEEFVVSSRISPRLISGYWQEAMFFDRHRAGILDAVRLKPEAAGVVRRLSSDWGLRDSIAVHVRRGDYFSERGVGAGYAVCDERYFRVAIEHIRTKLGFRGVVLFSDDVGWAQAFAGDDKDLRVFDANVSPLVSIFVMSRAGAKVLSNSSFSWWSAFLGSEDQSYTVVPRYWRQGIETSLAGISLPEWVIFDD